MVVTRSQIKTERAATKAYLVALAGDINDEKIVKFLIRSERSTDSAVAKDPKWPKIDRYIRNAVDATDNARSKAAKIKVVVRLLDYLAQPETDALVKMCPQFAGSLLLKLDSFRTEVGIDVDRHLKEIFFDRGMLEEAVFFYSCCGMTVMRISDARHGKNN